MLVERTYRDEHNTGEEAIILKHRKTRLPGGHAARLLRIARLLAVTGCVASCGHASEPASVRHPEPMRTKGWSSKALPDLVTADSGRRSHVFMAGELLAFRLNRPAVSFEVRDYWGAIVDSGAAGQGFTVRAQPPGWYKLYLYGAVARPEWGDIVGGTMFVVLRKDPHFPALPAPTAPPAREGINDEVMRGVLGMGPQRHSVDDAAKPDEAIRKLETDIAIDRTFYLSYDPARGRALMIAFPNGTKGKEEGVRKIAAHFRKDVRYWEPRNEPNAGSSGRDFALLEMKPFYEAIKTVDPALRVLGPGTVTIGPQLLPWIEDFLKADGAKYIDAFSFHAYNTVNGDLWLARKGLDTLNTLLRRYGADGLEKWQTEQGFMAAVYGSYQPRLQGRWTMMQMMVYEQYGIPKEHNHLWYDTSHGFWDFPTWWENEDGSLNPAAPLMRVWSEELHGTRFVRAFDLGDPGSRLALGSLFAGSGRHIAAFMSAGSPDGQVPLRVHGGTRLHTVSAFGVERDIPVRSGAAVLPVPELPVYVELAAGQSIEPVPTAWGPNLARETGASVTSSAPPETDADEIRNNPISKLINGELENWYWEQKPGTGPWSVQKPAFPLTVDVTLPRAAKVSRVIVYAAPPWQSQGTLLDYELQVATDGGWKTIEHVREPTRTFGVYTPTNRTTVDSFFSDRWIFVHHFEPVTTRAIRLLIHSATNGGGATPIVPEAGGQASGPTVTLREIEIYGH